MSGAYQAVNEGNRWAGGDPCVGAFLELRVMPYNGVDLSMNPADFVAGGQTIDPPPPRHSRRTRQRPPTHLTFGNSNGTDEAPWTIKTDGGLGLNMDPRRLSAAPQLSTDPAAGTVEIWHLVNGGNGWSHPVHIHFEEGIILQRDGQAPPEWEKWARKDLYRIGVMPESGSSVDVAIRFREFAGSYMEHCHNTQHEDHSMLLRYDIEHPGQFAVMPTPMPSWDGIGYVDSVALPTARLGGQADPDGISDLVTSIDQANLESRRNMWNIQGSSAIPGQFVQVWLGRPMPINPGDPSPANFIGAAMIDSKGHYKLVAPNSIRRKALQGAFVTVVADYGGQATREITTR